MNALEKRNALTDKINDLKEKLKVADFVNKLEIKDEILQLEEEVKKITIQNNSNDCGIC
tara:strand:+ start:466 stop:642 length:177 start_codon:yes stop_codon:yes gene_type:complete